MKPSRGIVHGSGFTLVEMLVVLGIVLLLLGILVPMVAKSRRLAERKAVQLDLQAIATALEAYRQDMGDYPRSDPRSTGTEKKVLARALIAPGPEGEDGAGDPLEPNKPGPGFRLQAIAGVKGKVYGPYLPTDKFPVDGDIRILDRWKNRISYYPRTLRPTGNQLFGTGRTLFNQADGDYGGDEMRLILGDHNKNNIIDGNEVLRHDGPFILASPGRDGKTGPQADAAEPKGTLTAADLVKCDDVFNFD